MLQLPPDVIRLIPNYANMTLEEINTFCRTHPRINDAICRNEQFKSFIRRVKTDLTEYYDNVKNLKISQLQAYLRKTPLWAINDNGFENALQRRLPELNDQQKEFAFESALGKNRAKMARILCPVLVHVYGPDRMRHRLEGLITDGYRDIVEVLIDCRPDFFDLTQALLHAVNKRQTEIIHLLISKYIAQSDPDIIFNIFRDLVNERNYYKAELLLPYLEGGDDYIRIIRASEEGQLSELPDPYETPEILVAAILRRAAISGHKHVLETFLPVATIDDLIQAFVSSTLERDPHIRSLNDATVWLLEKVLQSPIPENRQDEIVRAVSRSNDERVKHLYRNYIQGRFESP